MEGRCSLPFESREKCDPTIGVAKEDQSIFRAKDTKPKPLSWQGHEDQSGGLKGRVTKTRVEVDTLADAAR